ncbi:MAG TPA: glycoside hydrolase family 71/99-like protein [Ohtaekwangia sp.]
MMKAKISCFLLALLVLGCGGSDDDSPNNTNNPPPFTPTEMDPKPVSKTENAKIYVHLMPWFETPETNGGNWGSHWKMANKNPNVVVDASTGKRQIASHYYPLIGPYASSDMDVVEYQLLLMKLSGIDGVLIDWYGTINLYDYPANLRNVEAFTSLMDKVGLQYAIVYEDQTIKAALDAAKITDGVAAAKADMNYMQTKYFNDVDYIKISGQPLLLTFGPQYFQSSAAWTDVFSVLTPKPRFFTLWNESAEAGSNASGEYAWVYQNTTPHLDHLDNFYNKTFSGLRIGSAYPGFNDYYQEGGWGDGYFVIEHDGIETFKTTLKKALDHTDYVQLVTWNDYGEGTMIEPTMEFGYSFLTLLQTTLGVVMTEDDLKLVARLYALRKANKNSVQKQKKLDQVFYYLVSLELDDARLLMDEVETE